MSNAHLHKAKKAKADEFYTTREAIEKELSHYQDQLEGKWVYSPYDDYRWSNFPKYFVDNFHSLGISHYTCTNYDLGNGAWRFDYDGENTTITPLQSNGDFQSEECTQIMKDCDILKVIEEIIKNIPPPPSGYTYDFDNPEIRKVGDNWEVTVNLCLKDEYGRLITIENN